MREITAMKTYAMIVVLLLFSFICIAQGQDLSIRRVVSLTLENDTAVRSSHQTLKAALSTYRSLLADKRPQLALSSGYGLDYTSQMQDILGNEYENYRTHSISLGFTLDQLVRTYGTVSVGLGDQLTVTSGIINSAAVGPSHAQSPGLSISFAQPVFFNGKIIDGDLYRAVFRRGEIDYLSTGEKNRIYRNQAILDAIGLLFDVVSLKNEISKIEKAIELKNRGLENLQSNFEKGFVAETEVWEMRVAIGKEREYLLQNVYALRQKEGDLRLTLGIPDEEGLRIPEVLLEPELELETIKGPEEIFRKNPNIKRFELALEQVRLNRVLDGSNDASTLTVSLSLSPRYPYERPESNLGDSFSDFFDELSGWDAGFAVDLAVPLYNGSKWKLKTEADEASERALREELLHQKGSTLLLLRMGMLMQENLKEKILLLEDNLQLKKRQAEVDRELLKIGQTAELEVIKLEIEYFEKENELKRAMMDLYLTRLDLLSSMGSDLEDVIQNGS